MHIKGSVLFMDDEVQGSSDSRNGCRSVYAADLECR